MTHTVESKLGFLSPHAIYDTEKPYSCRFTPPKDTFPRHNLHIETKKVTICDARELNPTVEENGFALTCIPTKMSRDDFDQHEKIESIYAPELQAHLKTLFQARHVRVIDYAVRRRHTDFPISTGELYGSQQPATLVHLDYSYGEAERMLRTLYGDRADGVLQHRWQVINVWRPLKGPLLDWPLAICDARTFDLHRDAQVSDAVYPEWAYENVLVHDHPDHKWYYFPEMEETETMLFKCTDSDNSASGLCPHGSFSNPRCPSTESPRESVESRVFIFWAPLEVFPKEVGEIYGERTSEL